MRKITLFALTLALVVFMSSAAFAAKTIEVWQIHSPIKELMDSFDWAAEQFEAETGIKVNNVRIPTENLHSKLVTSISARQYPDMVIWNIKPGVEFSNLDIVAEVSGLIDEFGRDKFEPGLLKMFQAPLGQQWEIPLFSRLAGYHYRKDWLEDAGFNPEPVKNENGTMVVEAYDTWDDFYNTSKKLTMDTNGDGTIDRWGVGFQYNRKGFGDSASTAFSVMTSFGGHFLDPETNEVVVDSPETVAAYAFLKKIYEDGLVPESVTAWDGYDNNLNFETSKVGFVNNSNSIIPSLKEDNPEMVDKVGITVPPMKADVGIRSLMMSPDSMTLFKTDNLDAAKEYAMFLLDKETQVDMFKIMGVGYYGPVRGDVLADPFFDTIGQQERMFMEVGKFAKGIAYPGAPNAKLNVAYNSFVLDDALARISVDDWTPERAVAEIAERVKELMED